MSVAPARLHPGFTPDPFQQRALDALDQGSSVLVAAPTGSGKTLVADYAVDLALAEGRKAFYTTPLKALSNQKHRDLAARLGPDRVGLLTGDRVVNPEAPVVVMTTEVLRAMLHDRPPLIEGVRAIVLDEFHYLQDPERGPVWEEVCIHAPTDALLVCLSATVADVDTLAAWLRKVHGPTVAVVEDRRPVTLNHLYAVGNLDGTPPLVLPMFVDGALPPAAEMLDGARRRQLRGEGLRQRSRSRPCTPARSVLLEHMRRASMLPAIWFVLSRAGCDAAVAASQEEGVRLTSEDERRAIRRLADGIMGSHDARDLRAVGYGDWLAALEAGVAAHHGGMLPVQREIVELAFAEGLLKVAFATETLALGVNLPARSVVIDRVLRAHSDVAEPITASEFAQLAGRAGRRGIDAVGNVLVPWSSDVPFHLVASLAGGRPPSLTSSFRPTPAMAANLVRRHTPAEASAVVHASLAQYLREEEGELLNLDLTSRRDELERTRAEADCPRCLAEREDGSHDVVEEDPIAGALLRLEAGDVIVDPARPAFGRAVVVGTGRTRKGLPAIDVVRPDGRRAVVTPRDFRATPAVMARLDLAAWSPEERGHARAAARALAELPATRPDVVGEPETSRGPGSHCPEGRVHRAAHARALRLEDAVADLEHRLDELRSRPDEQLASVLRLLRERGHVRDWELTDSGQAVRRLFHESGLLVAECLQVGLFEGLDAPSVAALASCFTARGKGPRVAPARLPTAELMNRWQAVGAVAREVQRAEEEAGLPPTPFPEPMLSGAVYSWTDGGDLEAALASTDASAGDLAREVKQVVELLGQLAEVAAPEQAAAAVAASESMMRGVVVATALDVEVEPDRGYAID